MEQIWRRGMQADPAVVEEIVNHLKSHGIFDQFRYDSLADVDTKPAYQNLTHRVDGYVTKFLSTEEWNPDLNKNELRNKLRRQIEESGMLTLGVDHVVDQIVNPKINRVFMPRVEEVVNEYFRLKELKAEEKKAAVFESSIAGPVVKVELQSNSQNFDAAPAKMKPPDVPANDPVHECDNAVLKAEKFPKKIDDNCVRKDTRPIGSPGKAVEAPKYVSKIVGKASDLKGVSSQKPCPEIVKKEVEISKSIKMEQSLPQSSKAKLPDKKRDDSHPRVDLKPKEKQSLKSKNDSKNTSIKALDHKHPDSKISTDTSKSKMEVHKTLAEKQKDKLPEGMKVKLEDKKLKDKDGTSSGDSKKESSRDKSSHHKERHSFKTKSSESKEKSFNKDRESISKSSEGSNKDKSARNRESKSNEGSKDKTFIKDRERSNSSVSKSKESQSEKGSSNDREKSSSSHSVAKSSDTMKDKTAHREKNSSKHKISSKDKERHSSSSSSKVSDAGKGKNDREKTHTVSKANDTHKEKSNNQNRERNSNSLSKTHESSRDKSGSRDREKSKSSALKTSGQIKHKTDGHRDKSCDPHVSRKDRDKQSSSKSVPKSSDAQKERSHDRGKSVSSSHAKGSDISSDRNQEGHGPKTKEKEKTSQDQEKYSKKRSESSERDFPEETKSENFKYVSKSDDKLAKDRSCEKVNNSNPILKTKAPSNGCRDKDKEKVDNLNPILKTKLPFEKEEQKTLNKSASDKEKTSVKSNSKYSREPLHSKDKKTSFEHKKSTKENRSIETKVPLRDASKRKIKPCANRSFNRLNIDSDEDSSDDSDFDPEASDESSSAGEDSDSNEDDSADEGATDGKGSSIQSDDSKEHESPQSDRSGESERSSVSGPSSRKKIKRAVSSIADNAPCPSTSGACGKTKTLDADSEVTSDNSEVSSVEDAITLSSEDDGKNGKVKKKIPVERATEVLNMMDKMLGISRESGTNQERHRLEALESEAVVNTVESEAAISESGTSPVDSELASGNARVAPKTEEQSNDVDLKQVKNSNQKQEKEHQFAKQEENDESLTSNLPEVDKKQPKSPAVERREIRRKRKLNPKYASSDYTSIFNSSSLRAQAAVDDSNASMESSSTDIPLKTTYSQAAKVSEKASKSTGKRARVPTSSSSNNDSEDQSSVLSNPPKRRKKRIGRKAPETEYKITLKISKVQEENSDDDEEEDDDSSDETETRKRNAAPQRGKRPRTPKSVNGPTESPKSSKRGGRVSNGKKSAKVPVVAKRESLRERRKCSESGESFSAERLRKKSFDQVPTDRLKNDNSKSESQQQRSSKRYDSSDLYKPRPVIHSTTRRSRAHSPPLG